MPNDRLIAAELIFDVLLEKKSVQQALSEFPKDKTDINIKCAFDALLHREADEDLRKSVAGYKETQDEYLSDIAQILKLNQQLPRNIIQNYLKYHNDNLIGEYDTMWQGVIKNIKRMINF